MLVSMGEQESAKRQPIYTVFAGHGGQGLALSLRVREIGIAVLGGINGVSSNTHESALLLKYSA
jgi:hypothetical protein